MPGENPLVAYLFWHRPRPDVGASRYEESLAAGHGDWYFARGWAERRELIRRDPRVPPSTRWTGKPIGEDAEELLAGLDARAIWRRQLAPGPAPELCLADDEPDVARTLVARG